MRDTSRTMEAGRFSRRQRHAGVLLCALGAGLVAFTFVDGDSPSVSPDPQPARSTTSEASVLGVVITQPEATSLPTATPASPVEIDPAPTTRRAPTTTARPTSTSTSTTTAPATTSPDPTLIDPTVIENTTTTTDAPPPTTIDLSTTTTAGPTTTEPPPG